MPRLVKEFKTVCVCMCVLCVAQKEEALESEGERACVGEGSYASS